MSDLSVTKNITGTYAVPGALVPRTTINWLERLLPDPEDQREYSRHRVVIAVTEAIADAMERGNLRRSDIAERLGKSKSQISQILSGRRNMTLYTLGDVLWACGHELDDLVLSPLGAVSAQVNQAWEWYYQAGVEELERPRPAVAEAVASEELLTPEEPAKPEPTTNANADLALAA